MMRSAPDSTRLDEQEQVFMVPGPREGMSLFLRRLGPSTGSARWAVLYIHGATFPSGLSIAHRFDGRSWRDVLCDASFRDRKSTRLNSSHLGISYAVFCLKKKNT